MPAAQEQPGVRGRARRGQDGDRGGAGPEAAAAGRPRGAEGRRDLRARHRRAAGGHALPGRLRGALQGGGPGPEEAPAARALHRRDAHHGRRRCHHRRHHGPGEPDQAHPDRRRGPADGLDDLRGVQARRARPGPGPAGPAHRRGRAQRGRHRPHPAGPARALRAAPPGELHRRRARGVGAAGAAPPAGPAPARQRDRRDRRGRRRLAPQPSRGREPDRRHRRGRARGVAHGAHPRDPGHDLGPRATAHAGRGAQASRLRAGRGGRPGGGGDQARPGRAGAAGAAGRLLPVHGPDRRRKDGTGQAAGAPPGQRVPPLRHERVRGEALGLPPDRGAAGLRGLRAGRPAGRRRAPAPLLGRAARRDREGAPRPDEHPAAGDGPRHAHRQHRAQGRLPADHPDHDLERGLARDEPGGDRLRRRQAAGCQVPQPAGDRALLHPRVPQPSGRHRQLPGPDPGGDGDDRRQVRAGAGGAAARAQGGDRPQARGARPAGGPRLRPGVRCEAAQPPGADRGAQPPHRRDPVRPPRARRDRPRRARGREADVRVRLAAWTRAAAGWAAREAGAGQGPRRLAGRGWSRVPLAGSGTRIGAGPHSRFCPRDEEPDPLRYTDLL